MSDRPILTERVAKGERTLMGMNRPDAAENPQFLLNVMHWLSELIEPTMEPDDTIGDLIEPESRQTIRR